MLFKKFIDKTKTIMLDGELEGGNSLEMGMMKEDFQLRSTRPVEIDRLVLVGWFSQFIWFIWFSW